MPTHRRPSTRPSTTQDSQLAGASRRASNSPQVKQLDRSPPADVVQKPRTIDVAPVTSAVSAKMAGCRNLLRTKLPIRKDGNGRLQRLAINQALSEHHVGKTCREVRSIRFLALSEDERGTLTEAFDRCCNPDSDYLDAGAMVMGCWEAGLVGAGIEEKAEVRKICGNFGEMVDLHEFSVDVAPKVRQRLYDRIRRDLSRLFSQCEPDANGHISMIECESIVASLGVDAGLLAENFEGDGQSRLSFHTCSRIICKCQEKQQRILRDYEHEVKSKIGLDDDTFRRFRPDLVAFYEFYQMYDLDGDGTLNFSEITFLIKDLGLMPRNPSERKCVEDIFRGVDADGDETFSFTEFLELMQRVRCLLQDLHLAEQTELFNISDRERTGFLTIANVSSLLSSLGVVPHSRGEQEELAGLVLSADEDGSGTINFEEFQVLCQRIQEKLSRLRFDLDLDMGIQLGFTPYHVRDFSFVFDHLDTQDRGYLDLTEVHSGLRIMNQPVKYSTLEQVIPNLKTGEKGCRFINFHRFLELMCVLREDHGMFKEEEASTIMCVGDLDIRIMRGALERMKVPKQCVAAFSKDELIKRICRYLKVTPQTNLKTDLGIEKPFEFWSYFNDLANGRVGTVWND